MIYPVVAETHWNNADPTTFMHYHMNFSSTAQESAKSEFPQSSLKGNSGPSWRDNTM